ncbi:MAG: hypothetical protein EB101_08115, partial [Chitinophagia bacterium]|nr:hypothetical protein [Chitinophagia bacterium]
TKDNARLSLARVFIKQKKPNLALATYSQIPEKSEAFRDASYEKTFLLIHALQCASEKDKQTLLSLLQSNPADKVERVLAIYKNCGVDQWALSLKQQLLDKALENLEQIAVLSARKVPLRELAAYLIQREV